MLFDVLLEHRIVVALALVAFVGWRVRLIVFDDRNRWGL